MFPHLIAHEHYKPSIKIFCLRFVKLGCDVTRAHLNTSRNNFAMERKAGLIFESLLNAVLKPVYSGYGSKSLPRYLTPSNIFRIRVFTHGTKSVKDDDGNDVNRTDKNVTCLANSLKEQRWPLWLTADSFKTVKLLRFLQKKKFEQKETAHFLSYVLWLEPREKLNSFLSKSLNMIHSYTNLIKNVTAREENLYYAYTTLKQNIKFKLGQWQN